MGFKRDIGLVAFGLTLLAGAMPARSAPAREPLIVTTLSDPESDLVAVSSTGGGPTAGDQMQSFAQALDRAAAAQRQAIAQRCRSVRSIPAGGSGRDAWEANCRYQRH